jgi:AraC-like DNA-binding protein
MQPVRAPVARSWRIAEESASTPVGRWRIVFAFPAGPLAEWVEAVWSTEGFDCFEEEEILPRSRTEVLLSMGDTHWLHSRQDARRDRAFGTSFVSGLQRGPLHVRSPSTTAMSGVRLLPAGVAAFLRDTPRMIADEVIELDGILGSEVETLRDQVASTPDLHGRVLLLAAAVERHLQWAARPSDEVRFALAALHASRGTVAIRDIVRATGFSHRHVTERFRAEIGLAPKAYARLVRFESAFERLQTMDSVRWAEFALDCGYYDQAHLVREFRELAGATPTEVFRRKAPDGLGLLIEE